LSIYLVIPLLLIAGVLQASVVPHLALWGVFPDLPALVVVSWSLLEGTRQGVVWGFIAGLFVDLFSGAPFGAATLSLMAVGALSGLGQATVFRTHVTLPLIVMFLATLVYDLLFLLIVQIAGTPVAWLESLMRIILPSAALNTVLVPLVYLVMRGLHTWLVREEMEW